LEILAGHLNAANENPFRAGTGASSKFKEAPTLGLGTWQSKPGEVKRAVEAAIDFGYRHIDCAAVYGNEKEVGEALVTKIGTTIKREEVFIVSKLWNTCHEYKEVLPACQQTLKDLGVDYLDLYLIHWPISLMGGGDRFPRDEKGNLKYAKVDLLETWSAMEQLVFKGLVRTIGVSNFNSKQIGRILKEGKIPPACLQIECHPYLTQEPLINFCKERKIQVVAYSPLGSPSRPWATKDDPQLLQDPRLLKIAEKYKKSPAQVLLRFQIERGVAVIPKSVSPERIKQNMQLFDFKLTKEDVDIIRSFNRNYRGGVPSVKNERGEVVPRDGAHPEFPFHEPF